MDSQSTPSPEDALAQGHKLIARALGMLGYMLVKRRVSRVGIRSVRGLLAEAIETIDNIGVPK